MKAKGPRETRIQTSVQTKKVAMAVEKMSKTATMQARKKMWMAITLMKMKEMRKMMQTWVKVEKRLALVLWLPVQHTVLVNIIIYKATISTIKTLTGIGMHRSHKLQQAQTCKRTSSYSECLEGRL